MTKRPWYEPEGPPAYVYFVRGGDFVKIGVTGDMKRRLKSLQVSSAAPLSIAGVVECRGIGEAGVMEETLRTYFWRARAHGEWFRADALESFLAQMEAAQWRASALPSPEGEAW